MKTRVAIFACLLSLLLFALPAWGVVSITDYGAVGDCTTDDSAAFTSALAADTEVSVPAVAECYLLESGITIPAGKTLAGVGEGSRLEFSGAIAQGITLSAGSVLDSLYLDGSGQSTGVIVRAFVDDYVVRDVVMDGGFTYNMEIRGADGLVDGGQQLNCRGSAIALTTSAATGGTIEGVTFDGNAGFGIWVTGGATLNTFTGNTMTQGGLELIGVTYESDAQTIRYNRAEYSGDNGISVTSDNNIVEYNISKNNANNGIGVYGSFNRVCFNTIEDNGTQNAGGGSTTYAGINLTPQFGGLSNGNTVCGNFIRENRTTSQQLYGIKFERMQTTGTTAYIPWVSGGATGGRRYITAGSPMRVYRYSATSVPANMGAVEPTDTSGNVVTIDGTNDGVYLGAFNTSAAVNWQAKAYGNIIIGGNYGLGFFGNQWTADVFANNVILNPILSPVQVGFVKTASTIANNALIGGTDTFTRTSGSISHTISNNDTFGYSGVVSGGASPVTVNGTNIDVNPQFVGGPNPTTIRGFHLKSSSPLIGAGTCYLTGSCVHRDFDGRRHLRPPNIGAFATGFGDQK